MKSKFRPRMIGVIGLVAFSAAVSAAPILQPTGATSSVGFYNSSIHWSPQNTINQSGLADTYTSLVTDFDEFVPNTLTLGGSNSFNAWFAPQGVTTGTITFDLGGTFTIDGFGLWTDYQTVGQGVNDFTLFAALDDSFTSSTSLGSFNAAEGTGESENFGQIFSYSPTEAAFVSMVITSNHGSDFTVGFSEAAFRVAGPTLRSQLFPCPLRYGC
ncbi:hypothetical protein [Kineobactrum salinum]|uniref:PEP-CTERM sorting domain-containing protein n=1 Tax=Kineobactrum salinum TaxID=2708301 RepID=A0A6C0TZU0_9GAMM|nr:hypothetical protein [Kineobactrum salinum]QIB65301.1 hypothetical protein G3T16_07700 [Kineobactrum salinum]